MTSTYTMERGVRVRFWLGPLEGEEGTYRGRLPDGRVAVTLDSGRTVAEEKARVEVVIS